ncbi:MAG: RHS repeat-associated core domain-containing protein [Verrucomicrobia bacterium]|jgi:RHS repeat-associated protein|nr:RHS repeat-associated core domain-containing protein [Verrucomicrobiota bacterium]
MAQTNPFRFSTQYQDEESDLLDYGYRYYNASTGRWPNRDPVEERGGRNLHGFIRNNPISRFDRLGLSDHNSPSGNLEMPFSAQPCGNATTNVNSRYAKALTRVSIKIIVVAPGEGGRAEGGEIGPFPIGTRWLPMSGDVAPNIACRMKYKCTIKCCCASGNFNPVWKGNEEWVYGRVVSRMKITKWTGQQEKDENGNWVWTNAKCGIDSKELEKANKHCRDTSKGKCETKIQLRSH